MTLSRPIAVLSLLVACIAAACHDSTDPGPAALTGNWAAVRVDSGRLPTVVRCSVFSCMYVTEMQLRFRSRGRVLDLRRYMDVTFPSDTSAEPDYGDAFAYRLFGRDSIELIRPFTDTAWADTGVVVGDTIFLHVRKLDQRVGGIGAGRGPLVRYARILTPAP